MAYEAVSVRKLLEERGYTIISVVEQKKGLAHLSIGKVNAKDRSIMYREVSTMLKAGVGITQAVDIAAETPNRKLKAVMREVYKSLENGFPLSVAMSGHPKTFPEVEIGVIRAGEATGNLSKVLDELSVTTARTAEFISRVRGAMIYPAFILVVMVIVGFVILTRVIPPIKDIFESTGSDLPISTQMLLAFTDFLINQWYYLIAIIVGLVVAVKLFTLTRAGKDTVSYLALNFPIFGGLTREVYLARFNRTLALLIGAGVPIIESVDIIADSTTNTIFTRSLKQLRTSLEQGAAISSTLQKSRYFPKLMTQLLLVGQQSGDLGGSASTLAEYFETEVDAKLRTFSSLVEPFIIVLLGGAVGFIVISVLQPIYNLTGQF
ncbi:MAG: type II secretion system F family protein [Candidatus Berkelbacteria bacterium]|nr:MAG: type II secretion system F family protein [Candidatus Berkelbacteria bacterium]QQG51642.1 MAG: type II secretion system F family protein [Candidatus Berkelbacteria bacterium]